jgi:hypothetical protein
MPAKPQWLLHIPEISAQLRAMDVPVVDRSACEKLFGVGRRQAIELMHHFGGYQSGNAVLLDRRALMIQLEVIGGGSDVEKERRRKARLAEKIEDLHRYRAAAAVRIPVVAVPAGELPAGVTFGCGRMIVEFSGVEDLLSKLYALAQRAALEFESFRETVTAASVSALQDMGLAGSAVMSEPAEQN